MPNLFKPGNSEPKDPRSILSVSTPETRRIQVGSEDTSLLGEKESVPKHRSMRVPSRETKVHYLTGVDSKALPLRSPTEKETMKRMAFILENVYGCSRIE